MQTTTILAALTVLTLLAGVALEATEGGRERGRAMADWLQGGVIALAVYAVVGLLHARRRIGLHVWFWCAIAGQAARQWRRERARRRLKRRLTQHVH